MLKRFLSLLLIISIFSGATVVLAAGSNNKDDEIKRAEKVKNEIRQFGTGPDAQIKLKLRDKTELEGYISQANENDFTVISAHNGTATNIPYPQVRTARGNNLSGGARIAIGVGIAVAVIFLVSKYGRRNRRYGF